jgi:hypothetical protein
MVTAAATCKVYHVDVYEHLVEQNPQQIMCIKGRLLLTFKSPEPPITVACCAGRALGKNRLSVCAHCWIVSADQAGAKRSSVRNDCVTPKGKSHVFHRNLKITQLLTTDLSCPLNTDGDIEENRGKQAMMEGLRSTKHPHEEPPLWNYSWENRA